MSPVVGGVSPPCDPSHLSTSLLTVLPLLLPNDPGTDNVGIEPVTSRLMQLFNCKPCTPPSTFHTHALSLSVLKFSLWLLDIKSDLGLVRIEPTATELYVRHLTIWATDLTGDYIFFESLTVWLDPWLSFGSDNRNWKISLKVWTHNLWLWCQMFNNLSCLWDMQSHVLWMFDCLCSVICFKSQLGIELITFLLSDHTSNSLRYYTEVSCLNF